MHICNSDHVSNHPCTKRPGDLQPFVLLSHVQSGVFYVITYAIEFVLPRIILRSKLSPAQCSLTMVYADVSNCHVDPFWQST